MGDADRPERAIDVERGEQEEQCDREDDVGDDQGQDRDCHQQLLPAKAIAGNKNGHHRRQQRGDEAATGRYQHAVTSGGQRRRSSEGVAVPLPSKPLQRKGENLVGIEREEHQDGNRQVEQGNEHGVVAAQNGRRRAHLPRCRARPGPRAHAASCRVLISRRAIVTKAIVPTSITNDMAAPSGQFAALVKKSWIRLTYIEPALPPTRSGVTYSPTVGMKHMKNPAITPGRLNGSTTRQKRRSGGEPRSAAASKSVVSIRCRPARIGNDTNGTQT